jgi:hypothetical protein
MGKRIRHSIEKLFLKRRELDNYLYLLFNLNLKMKNIKNLENELMNEPRPDLNDYHILLRRGSTLTPCGTTS